MIALTLSAPVSDSDDAILVSYTSSTNRIADAATNQLASFSDLDVPNTLDPTTLTVTIVTGATNPTNAEPVPFTITFSKAVTGFTATDITASSGTVRDISPTPSLSATSYTFNVAGADDGAVLSVSMSAGTVQDTGNNANTASNTVFVSVDRTAPTVTAASVIDASTIRLATSEPVFANDITPGDFTIAGVTGGNPTVTAVTVTNNTSMIALTLSAPVSDSDDAILVSYTSSTNRIADAATNQLASFSDLDVPNTLDPTTLTVTIVTGATNPTNAEPVPFTITFSKAVTGFTATDITASSGTVRDISPTPSLSATSYTFNVAGADDGAVLSVSMSAGTVQDTGNNANTASNTVFVSVDRTAPTVTAASVIDASTIRLVLSEPVSANGVVTPTDFAITGVVSSSPAVTQVTVTANTNIITLTISPSISGTDTAPLVSYTPGTNRIADAATNQLASFSDLDVPNTLDPTTLTVTIATDATNPTNAEPVPFTISFSKAVTGFTATDITASSGTVQDISPTPSLSTTSYTFNVAGADDGAVLSVSMSAGTVQDTDNNANTASNTVFVSVDRTAPTVTAASVIDTSTIRLVLSEPVSANGVVTPTDFAITGVVSSSPAVTQVTITANTNIITLTISPSISGTDTAPLVSYTPGTNRIADAATNQLASFSDLDVPNTLDPTTPTVTIVTGSPNPTNADSIPFTISFSKAVTGFTATDITASSGTVQDISPTPSLSTTSYTFNVAGADDGAVLSVSMSAGTVQDTDNNANTASNTVFVSVDRTAPTVTAASVIDTSTIRLVLSEPVSANGVITPTDFAITGVVSSNPAVTQVTVTANTNIITLTISPSISSTDTAPLVSYTPGTNRIADAATNQLALFENQDVTPIVDSTSPTVTFSTTASDPTNVEPVPFTITFSKAVTGFDTTDITASSGTVQDLSPPYSQSTTSYTFNVAGADDGVVLSVSMPAGTVQDTEGNANAASNTVSVSVDRTAPTVTAAYIIAPTTLRLATSEPVFANNDVAPGDFTIAGIAGGNPTVTGITITNNTNTFTLTLSVPIPVSDDTPLVSYIPGTNRIADAAANQLATFSNQDVTDIIDTTPPTVALSTLVTNPTNIDPISFIVRFSEAVTGFTATDITHSSGTIQNFDSNHYLQSFRENSRTRPFDVAINSTGHIHTLVSDTSVTTINVYDTNYNKFFPYLIRGSLGSADENLNFPQSMIIDSNDDIYIVDTGNDKIKKFSGNGTYLNQFGSNGTGDGQFGEPNSIAINSTGHIYVTDSERHRVHIFDSDYSYQGQIGGVGQGDGEGEFDAPRDIAIDSDDNVYVTDYNNDRVSIFDSDGTYQRQIGSAVNSKAVGEFDGPIGIAIDSDGNVYVSDLVNDRVQIFDSDGTYQRKISGDDSSANLGEFNNPRGIAIDANGDVYVADSRNNRVQKLSPTLPTRYTFDIAGPTDQETLTVSIPADAANNAVTVGNTQSNVISIYVDRTAPTVISAATTSATSVELTVSEPVSGTRIAPGGFVITDVDSTPDVSAVVVSGTTITLILSAPITESDDAPLVSYTQGTNRIIDAARNPLASFNNQAITNTIDSTAPVVTIAAGVSDPTNADPVPFTITFSEAVTGFDTGDIAVSSGTVQDISPTPSLSATSYTFNVAGAVDGNVLDVRMSANTVQDTGNNANAASNTVSVSIDRIPPTVTAASLIDASTIRLATSEPVFANNDITLGDFTIAGVTGGNPTVTAVTVTNNTSMIALTLSAPVSDSDDAILVSYTSSTNRIADAATNQLASFSDLDVPNTLDPTTLTVTIVTGATNPTNAEPVPFTITFSKAVTGFTATDITASSGTVRDISPTPSLSATSYTFNVAGADDGAVLSVSMSAGTVQDTGNNANTASNTVFVSVDRTAPTVTAASVIDASTIRLVLSEPVSANGVVTPTDFAITGVVSSSPAVTQVTVTANTNIITLTISPSISGTDTAPLVSYTPGTNRIADAATNQLASFSDLDVPNTLDPTTLTVTIATDATNPTNAEPVPFTITFSKAVTGFTATDITASSGTVQDLSPPYSQSTTSYTFNVTGSTDGAVLSVSMSANTVQDTDGNANTASNTVFVSVDRTAPTVTAAYIIAPTTLRLATSEPVFANNDVAPGDFTIAGIAGGNPTVTGITITNNTNTFTLTLSVPIPVSDDTPLVSYIPGTNRITDAAANQLATFSNQGVTDIIDTTPPTVALSTLVIDPTNIDPVPFIVRFSEAVTGFTATDITHSSGTIQNFDSNNYLTSFRIAPNYRPYDVAINSTGHVYTLAVDVRATLIHIYDSNDGQVLPPGIIKSYGAADDQLRLPRSMFIDSNDDIYITDTLNARIQKFSSNLEYIEQFGVMGTANGEFRTPDSIAINSTGYIYVTDFDRDLVNIFSGGDYAYQGQLGGVGNGTANGQFNGPRGIVIDSDNNVYIADSINDRIQIFNNDGTYQRQIGGAADSTADGEFNDPIGIALDSDNNIYVTELVNDRVQIFNNDGTYLKKISGVGSSRILGEFVDPRGIAVASDGDVYVADSRNERFQKLSQIPTRYTFDIAGPTDQETLTVSIPADAANNAVTVGNTPSNVISIYVDRTAPIVISAAATSATSVELTVSEPVSGTRIAPGGFVITDVDSAPDVSAVVVSGTTITLILSAPITESDDAPLVSYTQGTNRITDAARNPLASFDNQAITNTIDSTAPVVTIAAGVSDPTNADPVPFTITFSEAVTGFTASDIAISSGTVQNISPTPSLSATSYTFDVAGADDGNVLDVRMSANTVQDTGNNANAASNTVSVSIDRIPPRVTAASLIDASTIRLATSEPVFANNIVTPGDFTIAGVTGGNPAVTGVAVINNTSIIVLTLATPVSDSDDAILVSYTSGTNRIADAAANQLASFSDLDVPNTLDPTTLTVTIATSATNPTNAEPVPFTITFSKAVTGFTATDITASSGTVRDISPTPSLSATSYTFNVAGADDGAVLSVSMSAGTVQDTGNNANTASNTVFVSVDRTAPTVTAASVIDASTIRLVLSEPVSANGVVTPSDFAITGVVSSSPAVTQVTVTANTNIITLTISPSISGTDTAPLVSYTPGTNRIADAATNQLASFSDQGITNTLDPTTLTVTIVTGATNPTNAEPVPFTITFSKAVTGFTATDITASSGTVQDISPTPSLSTTSYTFNVAGADDGAVLSVSMSAGTVQDTDGNANAASNTVSVSVDRTAPTVTAAYIIAPTTLRLATSEPVFANNDVAPGDFTITGIAGGNPTVTGITITNNTNTFTLTLSVPIPVSDDTPLVSYIPGTNRITDAATNQLATFSNQDVTDIIDTTPPTVALSTLVTNPTNIDPIPFIVRFSEAVTGFTATDITHSSGTVQNFDSNNYLTSFRIAPNYRPYDVAINSTGHVYTLAVDVRATLIHIYDSNDGQVLPPGIIKSYGAADDQLRLPRSMFIDSNDDIYITDTLNARIQKFSSNLQYIEQFGIKGTANGEFRTPDSIAINSTGHIYVTDFDRDLVNIFRGSDYAYQGQLGGVGNGTTNGQFNGPRGIVIDSDDNVYIADSINDRVQIFSNDGTYQRQIGSVADSTADGEFNAPIGIALDSDNNIYVTELVNDRVQIFSNDGRYQKKISGDGSSRILGEFVDPRGIAVASDGDVYVADSRNERFQKLSPIPTRYTFDIADSTDQETLTVSIPANATNNAVTVGNSPSNVISLYIDRTAPTVISAVTTSPTSVELTVSEPVSGTRIAPGGFVITDVDSTPDVSAVVVSGTTITLILSAPITESDAAPLVSYTPGTNRITDAARNPLASFNNQAITNTIDSTAPVVTIAAGVSDPTNADPVPFTITFSEAVTGFDTGDIAVSSGTVQDISPTPSLSATSYTFDVAGAVDGNVLDVRMSANTVQDTGNNANAASNTVSVSIDRTAPTVTAASLIDASTIRLATSEPVFANNDITLGDFTITGVTGGNPTVTAVTVTNNTSMIALTLSAPVSDSDDAILVSYTQGTNRIADAAANPLASFSDLDVPNTLDPTTLTVTIATGVTSPTNAEPVPFTITFSKAVTGFDTTDITASSGTVQDISPTPSLSATSYTFNVAGSTDGAVLSVSMSAGTVQDTDNNANTASNTVFVSVDRTAPTVTAASVIDASTIRLVLSEPVSANGVITPTDFAITGVVSSSPAVTQVTITANTNIITLTISPSISGTDTAPLVSYTPGTNRIADAATNQLASFSDLDVPNTLDPTTPTVTIATGATNPTNAEPVPFTITFSESVTEFDATDITASSGTVQDISPPYALSATSYTFNVAGSTNGATLSVSMSAGTVQDTEGNANAASNTVSVSIDRTPPTVTAASAIAPTTIRLTTSEPVFANNNVTPTDFTITGVTGGNPTVTGITITNNTDTFTLTLSAPVSGSDTALLVSYTFGTNRITDVATNPLASFSDQDVTNTLDATTPVVTIATTASDPTNAEPVPFTITFSEAVTGFAANDITVSSGTVQNISPTPSQSATSYTFDVAGSADGVTLSVSMPANAVQDTDNNANTASNTISVSVDRTAPTVTAASVVDTTTIRLVLSEPVFANNNVTPSDFTITGVAGSNPTVTAITITNNTDRVTLTLSPSISGTDTALLVSYTPSTNRIADAATNQLASFSDQDVTNTLDATTPVVTIATTASDPTNADPVPFTITFSEQVTGFTASDITVSSGTVQNISLTPSQSVTSYTFTVAGSADGSVLSVSMSANVVQDTDGNNNAASNTISVSVDRTAPTVTAASVVDTTTIRLVLSEPVFANNNVTPSDFTITGVAGSNPTVTGVTITANTDRVTLTLSAPISDSDTEPLVSYTPGTNRITDAATNQLASFNNQDVTNTLDTTTPVVTITTTASDPTNAEPVPFTITFSEQVTGFTASDITVSSGTVQNISPTPLQSVTSYTFTVAGPADGAVLSVSMPAGTVQDTDNNANAASNTISVSVDRTAPTVTAASVVDTTTIRLVLSEPVFANNNVTPSDFTITGVAGSNPTVTGVIITANTDRVTLTLSAPISGTDTAPLVSYTQGTNRITDDATNPLASFSNQDVTNTLDATTPVVTIATTASDPTNAEPVPFTITFSEQVTGFTANDITASSGTVQNISPTPSQSVTSYTFTVAGSADGAVLSVSMSANTVRDTDNNANAASDTVSVSIDRTAPTVSSTSATTATTVDLEITEPVYGGIIASTDFTISGVVTPTTVTAIELIDNTDTIILTLSAQIIGSDTPLISYTPGTNRIADAAGNQLAAFSNLNIDNNFDPTMPRVTITTAVTGPTNLTTIPFTLEFSEQVTGFATSDIATTAGTIQNIFPTPSQSATSYTFDVSGLADEDNLVVSIAAGAVADADDNVNNAFSTEPITIDTTAPTVSSQSAISAITIQLETTEPVYGTAITPADFTISGVTTFTTVTAIELIDNTDIITLTLSAQIIGSDNPLISYAPGTNRIADAAGNQLAAFSNEPVTDNFDPTMPVVTITTAVTDPTNLTTIPFTLQFSEQVTGFVIGDITTTAGTIQNLSPAPSQSATSYTFDVSGLADEDNLVVSIDAGAVTDADNNLNDAFSTEPITIDTTAPTVSSVTVTGITSITLLISEPVFGENIPPTDFILSDVAAITPDVSAVNVSNSTITLTLDAPLSTTVDTFTLSYSPSNSILDITDAAGNALESFDGQLIGTPPVVSLSTSVTSPTNLVSIPFTARFSEYVTGFDAGDVERTSGTVQNFTFTSNDINPLQIVGQFGTNNGEFDRPSNIALGGDPNNNNIYISDTDNNRIQIFYSNGTYRQQFGNSDQNGAQPTAAPKGIAVNSTGYVYLVDSDNDRIQTYDGAGLYINQFGVSGTEDGLFDGPTGIALDTTTNNFYVSDSGNNRIQMFDGAGAFIREFGSAGTGNAEFDNPTGIALDTTTNNIYVSDSGNNRIQVFNSTGGYLREFGSAGTGDGQFNGTGGIALDSNNNNIIYVSDSGNNRIQVFGNNGTYITQFGAGDATGNTSLDGPTDIALDSNKIYVTDAGNHRFHVFTLHPVYTFDIANPANPGTLRVTIPAGAAQDVDSVDNAASNTVSLAVGIPVPPVSGRNGSGDGESIPPSLTTSFDDDFESITINHVGVSPDKFKNNYVQDPPVSVGMGTSTPIQIVLYENLSWDFVSHVELCINKLVTNNQICDSDTKIIWDQNYGNNNDNSLEIIDPNNLINDANTSVSLTKVNRNVVIFDFDIEFAGVMDGVSDLQIYGWDTSRNALVFTVENAFEIVPDYVAAVLPKLDDAAADNDDNNTDSDNATANNTDSDNTTANNTDSDNTTANNTDATPDTLADSESAPDESSTGTWTVDQLSVLKKWAGYDTEPASDVNVLSEFGIEGDRIPTYIKQFIAWIINDEISQDEFVDVLQYLKSMGVLSNSYKNSSSDADAPTITKELGTVDESELMYEQLKSRLDQDKFGDKSNFDGSGKNQILSKIVSFGEISMIEFINYGTIEIKTITIWLDDSSFVSFKPQDNWSSPAASEKSITFVATNPLKINDNVTFGLETVSSYDSVQWEALDKDGALIESGVTVSEHISS